ncbi:MAG: MFS transporter [Candidatus Atabeyarchaeum deiterrae]
MNPTKIDAGQRLKSVYLLAFANAFWAAGYGMYGYIFPNFLKSVGATSADVGFVATILILLQAVTYIPGGILSDAGHRRALIIASWLLPAFAPLFFIEAEATHSWLNTIPGILLFASGWIGAPAVQSYVSEASSFGKRGLAFGIMVSSGPLGLVPSPLIGGLIYDQYGITTLFQVAFALYVISTAMVLAVPRLKGDYVHREAHLVEKPAKPLEQKSRSNAYETGVKSIKAKKSRTGSNTGILLRRLVPMVILSCLFLGLVYIGSSFVSLYLMEEYGYPYSLIQIMFAIQNLSSAVVVTLLGKLSDRYPPANKLALVAIPAIALIMGYSILLLTSNPVVLSLAFVFIGSVSALFPIVFSVVGELSKGGHAARSFSIIMTILYVAEASTPFLGGVLYGISAQLPFVLMLSLSPLVFALTVYARRKTH